MAHLHIPTKRELLRRMASADLTGWSAYFQVLADERKQAEAERGH